jgi:hypothetical protein
VVTTIAGTAGSSGSADGTGGAARFNNPTGVAVDGTGNVYVADCDNDTIRKITSEGVVTTIAGTALSGGGVDGAGTAARFANPFGVAVDGAGNLYVTDLWGNTIRKISSGGVVTSFAGGHFSIGSADGTGSTARFNFPAGVTVDGADNVYVADDGNNLIRKITPTSVVTTLAGAVEGFSSVDGAGSMARFASAAGLAVDGSGNIYVSDGYTVRKITSVGVVTTLAGTAGSSGSADGIGSAARFTSPTALAVDDSGNSYVLDNDTVRKITSGGMVTTLAGMAGAQGSIDGTGSAARFYWPNGVAVDGAGNVYVADTGDRTIRKITSNGEVTTFAGTSGVMGLTDGTGSAALFYWPTDVAVDSSGNLYVSEGGIGQIRKITSSGVVTTIAGSGSTGLVDGIVTVAEFYDPRGLAVDRWGNIYVAETTHHVIRKIASSGIVTTIGGMAGVLGCTDATGSAARFNFPGRVAVDSTGNIYVADSANNTIRKGSLAAGVPAITTQPTSQTVAIGNSVTFTAAASGTPTPTYQWQKNGMDILGATSSSYTIASVTANNAGAYTVVATNVLGWVSSDVTHLVVMLPPSNAIITITVQ